MGVGVPVDDDHLVGRHVALAEAAGGHQEAIAVKPGGEVAVCGCDVVAAVHQLTDAHEFLAQGALGLLASTPP